MPIKTRVDILTTGIRTPIGVKVFGSDLATVEQVGAKLEELLAPVPGTRSVLYERNLGGLYLEPSPIVIPATHFIRCLLASEVTYPGKQCASHRPLAGAAEMPCESAVTIAAMPQ